MYNLLITLSFPVFGIILAKAFFIGAIVALWFQDEKERKKPANISTEEPEPAHEATPADEVDLGVGIKLPPDDCKVEYFPKHEKMNEHFAHFITVAPHNMLKQDREKLKKIIPGIYSVKADAENILCVHKNHDVEWQSIENSIVNFLVAHTVASNMWRYQRVNEPPESVSTARSSLGDYDYEQEQGLI